MATTMDDRALTNEEILAMENLMRDGEFVISDELLQKTLAHTFIEEQ